MNVEGRIAKRLVYRTVGGFLFASLLGLCAFQQSNFPFITDTTSSLFVTAHATTTRSGSYGNASYDLSSDGTLTIAPPTGQDSATLGDYASNPWESEDWQSDITKIDIKRGIILNSDSKGLFKDCSNVTQINGLTNLDTSHVTTMQWMLQNMSSLTGKLVLSSFKTSNVTNMAGMLSGNTSLTEVDVSGFDTSSVREMGAVFADDSSLTKIVGMNFNTNNVTNLMNMFSNCEKIVNLDLSSFNTQKVTFFAGMFSHMFSLNTLDISNFSMENRSKYDNYPIFDYDYQLWKISLGANTHFTPVAPDSTNANGAGLMPVPGNNGPMAGTRDYLNSAPYWVAVENGTDRHPNGQKNYWTSDKLMMDRPSVKETYVWQQIPATDPTSIRVKSTVYLNINDKWDPQEAFISATNRTGDSVPFKDVVIGGDKVDTSKAGTYSVTYTYGGKTMTTRVIVTRKVNPSPVNPVNPTPVTPSSNDQWNPTTPNKADGSTGLPNYAATKGAAVYSTKKIYMYKHATFKKSQRIATYPKVKRINRHMFVIIGYVRSNGGALRYKVRDVNHGTKTAGKIGYITANRKYVINVYYKTMPKNKKITVISTNGIHAYKNKNLSGKVKTYKKGTHLKVKKLVKHNLTSRYQLSNGYYITANKKLIIHGNY